MRRGRPFRREAILILAITVGLVVVYALNPVRNYGGECKGMRWFILAMPFLFLALVFFVERGLGWLGWTAFAVCFAVSALNAFDALRIPWGFSEWDLLLTRIGLGSLPLP